MSSNPIPKPRAGTPRLLACLIAGSLLLLACSEPEQPTVNLYRAIHAGDLDQIKRHLFWGTDINLAGADGDYPLHVATRRGRVVIARELLDHGADVEARNRAGQTSLQVALFEGKTQVAAVLIDRGAKETPQSLLFLLAESGVSDRDSLQLLVRLGADVNASRDTGETALHVAVSEGHLLLVKRLIALGADVNAIDRRGRTPLSIATTEGRNDIVALLEPFGARLETKSHSGPADGD